MVQQSSSHPVCFAMVAALLSFLIHLRIYHDPHFLYSAKSIFCKRFNNSSSLIIRVTFEAVENLPHSSGVALMHILLNSFLDFVGP